MFTAVRFLGTAAHPLHTRDLTRDGVKGQPGCSPFFFALYISLPDWIKGGKEHSSRSTFVDGRWSRLQASIRWRGKVLCVLSCHDLV